MKLNRNKLLSLARPIGLGAFVLSIIIKRFLLENIESASLTTANFFSGFLIGISITFIVYYLIVIKKNKQSIA
jgi:hypothetical protein